MGAGVEADDSDFSTFVGAALRNYSVGYIYYIEVTSGGTPVANQSVSVVDNLGTAYTGTTDGVGVVALEVLEYTMEAAIGAPAIAKITRTGQHLVINGTSYPLVNVGTLEYPEPIAIGV